ncbi:MAG: 5-(carboxyamino)imidazole ribonucleotide synthase [Myxococcota bacterium]
MPTRIAILGGGQLARMTAAAAFRLGLEVGVVARQAEDSPATLMATRTWIGDWSTPELLTDVATWAQVVTLENEFVDARVLAELERRGVSVRPSAHTLATVQDKLTQKEALRKAGLPVPRFAAVESAADMFSVGRELGWPLMLKARRGGYDGYGNELVRKPEDAAAAFEKLSRKGSELMVEEFIPFTAELAIMVARNPQGEEAAYPVVETVQHAHMCHTVLAPAPVSARTAARAEELGRAVLRAIEGVGIFGIELFLLTDGDLLINELAPRPHNSGHFTIEACMTSQFENHVRAVMGLPLGDTSMRTAAAAMVNLLGSQDGESVPRGMDEALKVRGANVHIYGKHRSRPGRKMGHVTVCADSVVEAREKALQAARCISL